MVKQKAWKIGFVLGGIWGFISFFQQYLDPGDTIRYSIYEIIAFFPYWFETMYINNSTFGVLNYMTLATILFIILLGAYIGALVGYIIGRTKQFIKILSDIIRKFISLFFEAIPPSFGAALLSVFFFMLVLINYLPVSSADNMRYFLSAAIQSLAAILALVVSLSLVAVQITSQNYSPKIFKIFTHSRRYRSLIILYIAVMLFFGALLLMTQEEVNQKLAFFSIFFFLICLYYLLDYSKWIFRLINPEEIIKETIRFEIRDPEEIIREIILPISDVLNKAIILKDTHTLAVGLNELESYCTGIIKGRRGGAEKRQILQYHIKQTSRLINTSLKEDEQESINEISAHLMRVGIVTMESRWIDVKKDHLKEIRSEMRGSGIATPETKNYDEITHDITRLLSEYSRKIIEKRWEKATKELLNNRGKLIVKSQEERLLHLEFDILGLSSDFTSLSTEDQFFSQTYFIEALSNILVDLIRGKIQFNIHWYNTSLKSILNKSLEIITKEGCYKLGRITSSLVSAGIIAIEEGHQSQEDIKNHILNIYVIPSKENNLDACNSSVMSEIGNEGLWFAGKRKKAETLWICSILRGLGEIYILARLDRDAEFLLTFFDGIENNYSIEGSFIPGDEESRFEDELNLEIVQAVKKLVFPVLYAESKMERTSQEGIKLLLQIGMRAEDEKLKKEVCESLKVIKDYKNGKSVFNNAFKTLFELRGQGADTYEHEPENLRNFMNFCGSININLYEDLKL